MMDDLRSKVAVITGGASGIGFAMAQRFLSEGMRLVLADVDAAALGSATDRLGANPDNVLSVPTDVTSAEEVDELAHRTLDRYGAVHVVCNNAGVNAYGFTSWEAPLSTWRWVLDVNLWGVIHGIRSFVPHLVAADEGHIVNTSSMVAFRARERMGPYVASKHAIVGISEVLSRELKQQGSRVGVTVVCPGAVPTSIRHSARLWPDRLGTSAALGPGGESIAAAEEPNQVAPAAVADCVVEAVRSRRFLTSSHLDAARAAMAARARYLEP